MHPQTKTAPAELARLNLPAEFKALDAGQFTGYAAVFGNVDQGQDVIATGAFKEIVRNAKGLVKVLFGHRAGEPPIGLAAVSQDAKGLKVTGELFLEDPVASRAYIGMKAGAIDGLSIGYDVLPGGAEITAAGVRLLTKLKLWEVSIVNFAMNPLARIEAVKTAAQCQTLPELEDLIRERLCLSNRKAKPIANQLFAMLHRREEPLTPEEEKAIAAHIRNITNRLRRL